MGLVNKRWIAVLVIFTFAAYLGYYSRPAERWRKRLTRLPKTPQQRLLLKQPGAKKPKLVIYRMDGHLLPEKKGRLQCGNFWCTLKHGQTNTSGSDLAVFSELDVERYRSPPPKQPSDVWAFFSKEPQIRFKFASNSSGWNGMFNYSATFDINNEASMHIFRAELKKIVPHESIHFFPKARMKPLRALWFVSHCSSKNHHHNIYSGREQYVLELSKHIPIDIYSSSEEPFCRQVFGHLVKDLWTQDPDMSDYMFYLSFENSLCKDYVTEKLWKVLEANSTTIPIALGGLSMEDYEIVAPPNSFIHVKNFTSPAALAQHLRYVAGNDEAFHYYNQWRNEFTLTAHLTRGHGDFLCYFCHLINKKPKRIWNTFSKDYSRDQCLDMADSQKACAYYNLPCANKNITLITAK